MLVEVAFKGNRKEFFLWEGDEAPPVKTAVIVDADRGEDFGHVHGLPVVDHTGALVGVLSQTDLNRARSTEYLWVNWPGLSVRHLMTSPAITCMSPT